MDVVTILPVLSPFHRYPYVAVVRLLSPGADLAQPSWQNVLMLGNSSFQNICCYIKVEQGSYKHLEGQVWPVDSLAKPVLPGFKEGPAMPNRTPNTLRGSWKLPQALLPPGVASS